SLCESLLAAAAVVQQLAPGGELHAWAAVRSAEALLVPVDRLPALVVDVGEAARLEELGQVALSGREQPRLRVLQDVSGRPRGVFLVGADEAARAALDPAGAVHAFAAEHPAVGVGDHASVVVERHARQRDAAVADAPQDETARDHLGLAGGDRLEAA